LSWQTPLTSTTAFLQKYCPGLYTHGSAAINVVLQQRWLAW